MELSWSKKDLKFFKALQFWEYRTKVLEYLDLEDYALTVFFKDGRATILGLTIANLENEFELRQFSDWIFVICKKYKKEFKQIKIQVNPDTGRKQFIDLYVE